MADLGSTSAFYAARPEVLVEEREESSLTDGLLTMLVEENTEGLYRCEATFGNWGTSGGGVGFLYFGRDLLDFGKKLSLRIGEGEAAGLVFEGPLMGMEAHFPQGSPPEILVLAEDRFQDLRMTRRSRTFEDASDQEVIEQVASEHGLRTEIDIEGPTYPVLAQINQSDLAFLRERARAVDAEVWLQAGVLHAQSRARRDAGRVELTYGQSLFEFSVLADLACQRTSLSVSGWDDSAKQPLEFEADEAAIRAELNGFLSGSSLLQQSFGERVERIVHMSPFTGQEAQSLAEARYRSMARHFLTGRGLAEGDSRIRVGASVDLSGLGPLFDGQYYVAEACHTFDGMNGYQTRFLVERPGLGTG